VNNVTSVTRTLPAPSPKGIYYYAIRGVTAGGGKGKLSGRVAIAFINEVVSGVTYHSYFVLYKNSSGTKYVNAFNQNNVSRWLAFSNTLNTSLDAKALVSPNAKMYASAAAWTAPDVPYYGGLVQAQEWQSYGVPPNDYQWMGTACMGAALTGCE
jgi:hypothetical protein